MTRKIVTTKVLCKVLNKKEEKIEEVEVTLVGSFKKEERKIGWFSTELRIWLK